MSDDLFRSDCMSGERIPLAEFDRLQNDDGFVKGPFIDGFGSGHGEPYRPYRDVWGELKDGRKVWSNTRDNKG